MGRSGPPGFLDLSRGTWAMTARFHRGRRPRGITIIETIVLMTAVAAMLGLCVLMLQLLMRLSVDSRAGLDGGTSLDRLARPVRRRVPGGGAGPQCAGARPV